LLCHTDERSEMEVEQLHLVRGFKECWLSL
jgi:hypothetical protein